MLGRLTVFAAFCLTAGDACPAARNSEPAGAPARVVSLDYCADQFVLKLADRERILAVSPDARRAFSYMRDAAAGLPVARPVAEDVLVLKPDLVVRSYGGGPTAAAFFARAGVPVLQVEWASDLNDVVGNIERVAEGLGVPGRGAELAADMKARLAAIAAAPGGARALYMTPAGVTAGPGTLIHDILAAAGLRNFQQAPGWHPIPLERLAYAQPDLVAAGFFDAMTGFTGAWSSARHPVARRQLGGQDVVFLEGAWIACGGWFVMDAVEALARPGRR
ncbi:MAG: ABC transporter substrate-binding protein [Rhodospirillales bacterium]|nr:ABC transporter substrate-binding protein [Rhodospirillales bacterium]